ncbi:IS4 family transposase [Burkholderia ubonensis]|uniref:DNA polymerase n=1 Tax=Burkholderia ubonensis TaxID=101571 RepID=A0A106PYZ6_9BURK|nr:IS4 family transposase [Burkholderia ubonensis]KVZ48335.1 DNA polymerase [Burkholderia ubonensis]KWA77053.1 DNA polymerase [Burkholderia ubonensis]KWZ58299.1 DNA polymerase [Burkholderia ubonensis]
MASEDDIDDWASNEFGAAQLGDARLTQRLVALARQLSQSPHCSFPQSLNGPDLKAAYRFFDNPQADTDGVLCPHIDQTLGRMQQVPVVLAAQDTTEFNLAHLPATEGLGYCTGSSMRGFMMHSLLAVTPEGLPLGVLGMKTWVRPPEEYGKKRLRKKRPIQNKESVKWLEGGEHLATLKAFCPNTRIVGVSDREGDVYDVFMAERPAGADWLVRASWNRRVAHPERYLWETIMAAPVLGETELLVPATAKRLARTARLTVRCMPVQLRPPYDRRREKLPEITVFAVHALESDPGEGIEPLEWLLLTSVHTQTHEEALERLAWYTRRWTIESWHRVLKSGCRIEARQFGNLERFVRATALFAVISWRILYATLLARLDGDLPCEVLLQPLEWHALYCRVHGTTKLPDRSPSLAQVVLWIARLGGYLNRKHDHPPGPTVMWRGFLALYESTVMYRIFRQNE